MPPEAAGNDLAGVGIHRDHAWCVVLAQGIQRLLIPSGQRLVRSTWQFQRPGAPVIGVGVTQRGHQGIQCLWLATGGIDDEGGIEQTVQSLAVQAQAAGQAHQGKEESQGQGQVTMDRKPDLASAGNGERHEDYCMGGAEGFSGSGIASSQCLGAGRDPAPVPAPPSDVAPLPG